jgi:PhnB protein
MPLNPYLIFNGQCEAAFRLYEQALGGEIAAMMTFGDGPMAEQTPAELRGQIMHAPPVVGDNVLTGFDAPGSAARKCRGFRSR